MRLAVLLLALWTPAAWSMSPVKCSMVADAIFMLIQGQQVQLPPEFRPYVLAAGKFYGESADKEAYTHSTTFFMECLRTGGDVSKMYDPRHLTDPTKKFSGA
jgi:hypothetical protein